MGNELALIPMEDLKDIATAVFKGGLFAMPSPEATLTLMLLCQAEGLHPIQALRQYHIIKGRPAMRADAMQAAFQNAGGKIQWTIRTDTECAAEFYHPSGGTLLVSWTIEQAKRAGLTGNPTWQKFPRAMLGSRVVSEGCRAVLPSIVCGLYTPDEIENFADAEVIKPIKQNKPTEPKQSETPLPAIYNTPTDKIPAEVKVITPTPTQKAQMLVDKIAADRKAPAEFEPNDEIIEPIGEIKAADRPAPKSEVVQKSASEVAAELKLIRKLAADNGDAKTSDDIQALVKSILGYTKSSTMMSDAERAQVIDALRCM